MDDLSELARKLDCLEAVDKNDFQRRARILQALWRIENGFPLGTHAGKTRGALLAMPWAKQSLANFLTDGIADAVRRILGGEGRQPGSLIQPTRMYANLLSSQPLAFNLFVPLQRDLDLASRVLRRMLPGRCDRVTDIRFEYSPGRGDGLAEYLQVLGPELRRRQLPQGGELLFDVHGHT